MHEEIDSIHRHTRQKVGGEERKWEKKEEMAMNVKDTKAKVGWK